MAPPSAAKPFPGVQAQERSIEARPGRESYPSGTTEITLEVKNLGEHLLGYTGYFDFRRVDGEQVIPLNPRPDVQFDLETQLLHPGESVTLTIPIDLFEQPLPPGVYRAAQLACFQDTQGLELACTEITADFTIE